MQPAPERLALPVRGSGVDATDQVPPFQCKASLELGSSLLADPTAQQLADKVQRTLDSPLLARGSGVVAADQACPFQCRATVRAGVGSSTVPLLAVPTAQQLPADVQATDSRTVKTVPGLGVETRVHCCPSQCKASLSLRSTPTAQQLDDEVQRTDWSWAPSLPPGCGMAGPAAEPAACVTADCCAAALPAGPASRPPASPATSSMAPRARAGLRGNVSLTLMSSVLLRRRYAG